MSRKSDFDPEDFFSDTNEAAGRRNGNRPVRRYYLLISEGTKTEPNYFDALKNSLPPEMVKRVSVLGGQADTLRLVELADKEIQRRSETSNPPFYHIWIIFDKDSFEASDFDNAIELMARRNRSKIANAHWHAAWSNEAFELWYLYHFQDQCGGGIKRTEFKARLSDLMKSQLKMEHGYRKNAKNMFGLLRERLPVAIKRAERVDKSWSRKKPKVPYHLRNPGTTVYALVKDLMRYAD